MGAVRRLSVCVRTRLDSSKLQVAPLRYPDFLCSLVALIRCMRLSLRKGAHVDLFGVA
jgi:hypothetical protein